MLTCLSRRWLILSSESKLTSNQVIYFDKQERCSHDDIEGTSNWTGSRLELFWPWLERWWWWTGLAPGASVPPLLTSFHKQRPPCRPACVPMSLVAATGLRSSLGTVDTDIDMTKHRLRLFCILFTCLFRYLGWFVEDYVDCWGVKSIVTWVGENIH